MPTDLDRIVCFIVEGIPIYTGKTACTNRTNWHMIHNLRRQPEWKFTHLRPSTMTISGMMRGVAFDHRKLVDQIDIKCLTEPTLSAILSNFGRIFPPLAMRSLYPLSLPPPPPEDDATGKEIYSYICNIKPPPAADSLIPVVDVKTNTRGKRKTKTKQKRKLQGMGWYMNSQVSFYMYCVDRGLDYKIRLFTNGTFGVPGVLHPNMKDIIPKLKKLEGVLAGIFGKAKIHHVKSVMRNYTCRCTEQVQIEVYKLYRLLTTEKESTALDRKLLENLKRMGLPPAVGGNVAAYLGTKNTEMGIAEIEYNAEKGTYLVVRFYRPISKSYKAKQLNNKRTTVKIFRSGKINFGGGNSKSDIEELYLWMGNFFCTHHKTIFYKSEDHADDETSSEEDDGIYE